MTDYPQWSTVKAELDDPSVSTTDKQALLADYANAAAYNSPMAGMRNDDYVKNQDEISQYAQQYNATDYFKQVQQPQWTPTPIRKLLQDQQAAGKQAFDTQQAKVQNDQAVGKANTDLANEAGKTVAQGGSGAATSDEVLDPGAHGLDYFQYFIPPYKDWTGGGPDLDNDIKKVYDNLPVQFLYGGMKYWK